MAQLLLKGRQFGPIHGVLFDKDGTLSHSEPNLLDLVRRRIASAERLWRNRPQTSTSRAHDRAYQLTSLLEHVYGVHGDALDPAGTLAVAARQDNLTSMASVFCLMGCSWPEALTLSKTCFEQTDEGPAGSSALLPGAEQFLQRCQQGALTMAVISNDTAVGVTRFLAHHQLNDIFAPGWSADDHPRKPDPQAVRSLCQRLNLQPECCALIGDAETDLVMARDAGIGVVLGYRGGWQRQPQLSSSPHCFEDWSELEVIADP